MQAVVTEETITVSCEHVEDERHVSYILNNEDGNLSINENIENEIQEVNISFNELINVIVEFSKHMTTNDILKLKAVIN
ncbi:hypothetical protein [Lysinibacillus xylanilyticus]|uniref:hypothetical protein n=1 Tax=Lysinibacillus xylanilyticus TaxID=582475 RepID=UPI003D00A23B